MKWFKHDFDEFEKHRVRELAEIYQFDQDRTVASIISSIFLRRGRTSGEELMYFQEENLRLLHNPFAMQDMDALVKRIHQAVGEQERVWVFGDRDADGITSTVLMVELLRGLGLDPSWSVPMGDDDYGLTREWIDQVGDQDGTLIITVDCGVTDIEEVNYAREKGIDVIIVDHHTPKPTLPEAVAIVDPKREDTEYPFRELAACGVTAKVGWALDYSMTELYNQPVCLMNIRPANDTYVIEAVKLVNLLTVDSLDLTITPGIFDPAGSPIAGFFQECRVAVYDEPLQRKMLRECFGQDADEIPLIDLKPEIEKVFPKLAGKSLVYLLSRSRMNKYRSAETGSYGGREVDLFAELYRGLVVEHRPVLTENLTARLDLVAIGTIADMMPLLNENRILVSEGLRALSSTKRRGLRALMGKTKIGNREKLTSKDVSYHLAPALNATGRMGEPDVAVRLLLDDEARAEDFAEEVNQLNQQRRKLGEGLWETLSEEARTSLEEMNGNMLMVVSRQIHRGITGILSSRLSKAFQVPAVVIAFLEHKAVGSIRSARGFNVHELLKAGSDLFLDSGGHDFAAGFSISAEHIDALRERFATFSAEMNLDGEEEERLEIDAELPPAYVDSRIGRIIDYFGPYGEQNPPVTFLSRGMEVGSIDLVGSGNEHVKMLVQPAGGSGKERFPALYWNAADKINGKLKPGSRIDLVYRVEWNFFQQTKTLQFVILDMHFGDEHHEENKI